MVKRVLILAVLLNLSFSAAWGNPAQNAGAQATQERKTSEPYTGDLSIFESPGRDERLQVDRVMDVLGIAPGKRVADIGADRAGSPCERQSVSARRDWFTPWTSIQRRFAISGSGHKKRSYRM